MGQVNPYNPSKLHTIDINNQEGLFIGRLEIIALIHTYEAGPLDPHKPPGPDNRRFKSEIESYIIEPRLAPIKGLGDGTTEPQKTDKAQFEQLAEELKKNKGILLKDGTQVMLDSSEFPSKFKVFVNQLNKWVANFK